MNRIASFIFGCLVATNLVAQTQLSLSEAQELARANYPLIEQYGLIQRTEQLTLSNIQKGWLPQISFDAQATLQSDVTAWPSEMATMLSGMGLDIKGLKKNQYRIALNLNQQIYDGGATRAQRQVAQAEARAQEAQTAVDLYTLRQRVDDIFFSLLLTDQRIALSQEVQRTLQSNEDRLSAMRQNGTALQADVDAVRAERLSAVQQEEQLSATRRALHSVLSTFIGREDWQPAAIASLGEVAEGQRPEYTLFGQQLALTQARERQLRSALMPRLSLFATGFYGYPGYNMFEDMMQHKWSLNGMVGARLSWNIGALYTNKANRQQLATQRQQIAVAQETFRFNNQLQERQEEHAIEGYRRMLRHDDEIVDLRHSVRQAAEAKLEHGTVDAATLVQEISREHQAQLNRASHEIEMLQHQSRLRNTQGK